MKSISLRTFRLLRLASESAVIYLGDTSTSLRQVLFSINYDEYYHLVKRDAREENVKFRIAVQDPVVASPIKLVMDFDSSFIANQ